MNGSLSHDRSDELIENKTLWFRSLPLSERMEMLCSFTDLAVTLNPELQEKRHAESTSGRVQILSAT
jgi:hypothetical protein